MNNATRPFPSIHIDTSGRLFALRSQDSFPYNRLAQREEDGPGTECLFSHNFKTFKHILEGLLLVSYPLESIIAENNVARLRANPCEVRSTSFFK